MQKVLATLSEKYYNNRMNESIISIIRRGKTPQRGFDFTITRRVGKYNVDFLVVATHPTDASVRYEFTTKTQYSATKKLNDFFL